MVCAWVVPVRSKAAYSIGRLVGAVMGVVAADEGVVLRHCRQDAGLLLIPIHDLFLALEYL